MYRRAGQPWSPPPSSPASPPWSLWPAPTWPRWRSYIHSTGFFRAKARDIVAASRMLVEQYGGRVPDTMEELLKLPGVGRKTANLILGDVYHKPGVVVARHPLYPHHRPAGPHRRHQGPGQGGAAAPGDPAPGGVQRLLPPDGPPRPGGVYGPASPTARTVPCGPGAISTQKPPDSSRRGPAGQTGGASVLFLRRLAHNALVLPPSTAIGHHADSAGPGPSRWDRPNRSPPGREIGQRIGDRQVRAAQREMMEATMGTGVRGACAAEGAVHDEHHGLRG